MMFITKVTTKLHSPLIIDPETLWNILRPTLLKGNAKSNNNSSFGIGISSCDHSDWYKLCPKHKHYNRLLNTKQNLLCNNKSGLEVITAKNGQMTTKKNNTSKIEFVYTRPLSSSYKLLLDTTKIMGDNNRWQYIRRSLHRFIQMLPPGSMIRCVFHFFNLLHNIIKWIRSLLGYWYCHTCMTGSSRSLYFGEVVKLIYNWAKLVLCI